MSAEAARARLQAGDLRGAHGLATEGLASSPDDVELLRLAGRAGVELGTPDATAQLRRVAELQPDDAEAWRDLGDALATDGDMAGARDAFQRSVELDPGDERALTALGHTAHATGSGDAVGILEQAAAKAPGASSAGISLVEMYRSMGQPEGALTQALKVAEASPRDTLAALDVAELSVQTGRHADALAAFERLRAIDEVPGHEIYALHGMILCELRQESLSRALELAREAAAIDARGLTLDLLAFLTGEGADEPSLPDVEDALEASLREHRRQHAEDRVLGIQEAPGG